MSTTENLPSRTEPPHEGERVREVAPHIKLPEPGQKRFPVGIVLIVLWVAVFLVIFIVLANLKQNPPNRQGPVIPDQTATTPGDDTDSVPVAD
ncbi:MAG: hypothetical protein ACIAQF_07905 [Phycisphaerales bacterium JB065]